VIILGRLGLEVKYIRNIVHQLQNIRLVIEPQSVRRFERLFEHFGASTFRE